MNRSYQIMLLLCVISIVKAQRPMYNLRLLSVKISGYEVHLSSDIQNKNRSIKNASYNGQSKMSTFFETFKIKTRGSIYHPNLMAFTFATSLGGNQNAFKQTSSGLKANNNLFQDIAFQSVWLGNKPFNLLIRYNQKYRRNKSSFFDNSINQYKRWDGQGNWRNPVVKMNATFSNDIRTENYSDRVIFVAERRLGLRSSWGGVNKGNGTFNINRNRVKRHETNLYNTDVLNTTLQFNNTIPLKNAGKTTVYTSLFGNTIVGIKNVSGLNWLAQSNYEWSNTLQSDASYFFRYNENGGKVSRNHTYNTNVQHQLYKSLTSLFSIKQNYYFEKEYQKQITELMANWDYTKKLPRGRLALYYSLKPKWEAIHSEAPLYRWEEELFEFDVFNTIILRNENIIQTSIEVYDKAGAIQFLQDIDYALYDYGNRVEIQKLPSSSISDSAEVLVRYRWEGRNDEDSQSRIKQFKITYDYQSFWGITTGYSRSAAEYPKRNWTTLTTEDEKTERRYFIKFNYAPVTVQTNYTISNSSITPYERFDIGINSIFGSYLTQYFLINLQYGSEYSPLRNDTQKNTMLTLEAFRRLSRALKINTRFIQKRVEGQLNKLFEQRWRTVLKFQNRKIGASISYEHVKYRFFSESETNRQWVIRVDFKT